mmetsp:Transcript_101865/g.287392  ORF Transcript_101865/g.287392 Transcript_101865/m.287392 type:complete len:142 (+) Transcript_101865:1-426(+)
MAGSIRAHVIGRARDLAGGAFGDSDSRGVELPEFNQISKDNLLDAAEEAISTHGRLVELAEADKCFLNDEVLACILCGKISACASLPLLQLSVVIAAKMFFGDNPLRAASGAFGERTWVHYCAHVSSSGTRATLPLLWYYL